MPEGSQPAYLQPKEESFGASFKLKHKNTARGALIDPLELTVIRKNYQVLVKGTMNILLFLRSALKKEFEIFKAVYMSVY